MNPLFYRILAVIIFLDSMPIIADEIVFKPEKNSNNISIVNVEKTLCVYQEDVLKAKLNSQEIPVLYVKSQTKEYANKLSNLMLRGVSYGAPSALVAGLLQLGWELVREFFVEVKFSVKHMPLSDQTRLKIILKKLPDFDYFNLYRHSDKDLNLKAIHPDIVGTNISNSLKTNIPIYSKAEDSLRKDLSRYNEYMTQLQELERKYPKQMKRLKLDKDYLRNASGLGDTLYNKLNPPSNGRQDFVQKVKKLFLPKKGIIKKDSIFYDSDYTEIILKSRKLKAANEKFVLPKTNHHPVFSRFSRKKLVTSLAIGSLVGISVVTWQFVEFVNNNSFKLFSNQYNQKLLENYFNSLPENKLESIFVRSEFYTNEMVQCPAPKN